MKIQRTKEYKKFKLISWNRDINKGKLKDIVSSMKLRNLTKDLPIIVNGRNEVLDGQHRLAACKELGIPVYYYRASDMNTHDIALIQRGTKWKPLDYVKYWKVKGNRNYMLFDKFLRKYNLQVSTALSIISYSDSGQCKRVREGKLEFGEGKFMSAFQKMDKIEDFKKHFKFYKNRSFICAISSIMNLKQYDHKRMLNKLEYLRLRRCANTQAYIEMIEEIYNHGARTHVYFNYLLKTGGKK
jgi:hypothetical protein